MSRDKNCFFELELGTVFHLPRIVCCIMQMFCKKRRELIEINFFGIEYVYRHYSREPSADRLEYKWHPSDRLWNNGRIFWKEVGLIKANYMLSAREIKKKPCWIYYSSRVFTRKLQKFFLSFLQSQIQEWRTRIARKSGADRTESSGRSTEGGQHYAPQLPSRRYVSFPSINPLSECVISVFFFYSILSLSGINMGKLF